MLVGKIPRGPPGGAQSSPEALRGKKFCLQKWGPNNSECFDLPRSTIVKNTLKKKKQKFFILINFYAKIEYVANLDYSANANSGMRQVLYLFHGSHSPSEESQKGCFLEKSPGAPRGAPRGAQSTPEALRGKKFCL